jgi:L-ascorbate metabolism protein UlaG (beta-lactamase superfamily)
LSLAKFYETRISKGQAAMVWFNEFSGVAILSPLRLIIVDPTQIDGEAFQRADFLLITHELTDHLDEVLVSRINQITGCSVVSGRASMESLRNFIPKKKMKIVQADTELTLDDLSIEALPCNHPNAANPVTYMITLENGVKIFHTSDSLPYPEMGRIGMKEQPDIVFCAISGIAGVNPRTGAEIAKLVKARVAIPYHGTAFPEFEGILRRELPDQKVVEMKPMEPYIYG